MKAYDYVEKLIGECGNNQHEFGARLKDSLVRLTKRYTSIEQEEIITKIIKGDIFTYIFVPEVPRKTAITINEKIQCGLALQSQPPTIDDLPKDTYIAYILVRNYSTLYFINKLDQNDKIKSFSLTEHELNTLVSQLKISGDSQVIPLLSQDQIKFITEITLHTPTVQRLSSTYPQEWMALTPSQANTVIQNPKDKNIIALGERYGAVDIDCLWVVQEEASCSINNIAHAKDKPRGSMRNTPVKHPEFFDFIKTIVKQGYITFIRNLEDYECQFDKETDYIKYMKSNQIVKEKVRYNTDNTSDLVKDVAIIRKASYKNELEKEVIVYRLPEENSNLQSNEIIKEHRKVPLRTVQDYFTENS